MSRDFVLVKPFFWLIGSVGLSTVCVGLLILITEPASAQSINFDFGEGGEATGRIVQIIALITVLSLAPSLLVMVTSFIRILIVLSFLRTAMGTQQTPPNQVLVSLALFLTFFIMMPTFEQAYDTGIKPMMEEKIDEFLYSWVSYLGNLFTKCAYDYPICKLFSSFTERVLRMVDVHKCNKRLKQIQNF